jgi:hypothetical protein
MRRRSRSPFRDRPLPDRRPPVRRPYSPPRSSNRPRSRSPPPSNFRGRPIRPGQPRYKSRSRSPDRRRPLPPAPARGRSRSPVRRSPPSRDPLPGLPRRPRSPSPVRRPRLSRSPSLSYSRRSSPPPPRQRSISPRPALRSPEVSRPPGRPCKVISPTSRKYSHDSALSSAETAITQVAPFRIHPTAISITISVETLMREGDQRMLAFLLFLPVLQPPEVHQPSFNLVLVLLHLELQRHRPQIDQGHTTGTLEIETAIREIQEMCGIQETREIRGISEIQEIRAIEKEADQGNAARPALCLVLRLFKTVPTLSHPSTTPCLQRRQVVEPF